MQEEKKSYFDGKVIDFLGVSIAAWLITVFTLGICFPWAVCMFWNWQTKHTIIEGKRLEFSGSGTSLFGNFIVWWLLSIITFGIYSLWAAVKLFDWKAKNTKFVN